MDPLLARLAGGDRRSIGGVERVVVSVAADPSLFPGLMQGLNNPDALIAQRAADAAEKLTRRFPDWLAPYKALLLDLAGRTQQPSLRWHCAQMLPRLALTPGERRDAFLVLLDYLDATSSIVRTCALQGLWDLTAADAGLRAQVQPIIARLAQTGSPAVRARCRRLRQIPGPAK